jgi:hypothetical protein
VDHAASAQRTRWRVVSGGGEIGKQAAALGCGAARRCIAAAAVRTMQRSHGGASGDAGVESWLENGWEITAIREKDESGDFLFLFPYGWQCCVGPFGHQGPPTCV